MALKNVDFWQISQIPREGPGVRTLFAGIGGERWSITPVHYESKLSTAVNRVIDMFYFIAIFLHSLLSSPLLRRVPATHIYSPHP